MARQRRPRPPIARRLKSRRSERTSSPSGRASARDTAIMAVVALAFIGAFWFALSKPSPHNVQPIAEVQTSADTTRQGPIDASAGTSVTASQHPQVVDTSFPCEVPEVTDGDTIRCGALRVRLASIDAPEMPGHCRRGRNCVDGDPYASKAHLQQLIGGGSLKCEQTDTDRYGRVVALCEAEGRDLSCAQVEAGHAIIRYGDLSCHVR